ncbi:MAG: class I SAM-dependent methyltransferase [Kofleriaceae bacterium]|nr:class I SAM-dependent methyltransferase [Myxococcales bacterium]MCB9560867.1 class I SAM-dependent methyltransferase [Kofleriaceae bacterium]
MNDPDRDATTLANRAVKNARHLGKWARREGVTCWRIYDRDIPEVPITIDTYEGRLVINDYRKAYADRDPAVAAAWLDAVAAAAARALEVAPDAVFVKRRERMAGRHEEGGRQYERLGERGAWFEVGEAGHRFRVNLSDYLDTGLFLDHRITRARVGAEAAGKRVLNLFCYTGAFTVHAARGGAVASRSIDLSRTYLDWAAANLALNAIDPDAHRLEHGDVRAALDDLAAGRDRFDLAIVDPPTFSNSKRMDGTFDVQRDHAELLDAVARVIAPGGVIWFSTNHRRFQLELAGRVAGWAVTDETRATIPPDFRDARVHRAWRLVSP